MSGDLDYELRGIDEQFQEEYDSLIDEIDETIPERLFMEIRENPRQVSTSLRGGYEGFRAHMIESIRVVFVCCDECIGRGNTDDIGCEDCVEIHGNHQKDPKPIIKLFNIENIEPHNRVG